LKEHIKKNITTYTLFFIWLLSGFFSNTLGYFVISASILLFISKNRFSDLFIGFFFILILSDSRLSQLSFAINTKVIYIILLFSTIFIKSNIISPSNSILNAFLPFLIFSLFRIFYSPIILTALQKTVSYSLILLIVPTYINLIFKYEKANIFKKTVFFSIIILFIGIIIRYIFPDVAFLEGRFRGIFGNPNGIGIFCTLLFLLFYLLINLRPNLFSKSEKTITYFAIISSMFLSGSRTALLSILIYFIVKSINKYSSILSIVATIAISITYNFIMDNLLIIIYTLGLEDILRINTLESGSGRLIAWNFAWENIQKIFFFGKGFAYTEYLFHKNSVALSILGHQGNAHNSYLTIWLNTGIIGFILFFSALFFLFYKGSKNSPLAFPILVPILISINFESWLAASLNPFTIIFIIIITILVTKKFWNETEDNTIPIH